MNPITLVEDFGSGPTSAGTVLAENGTPVRGCTPPAKYAASAAAGCTATAPW